jgi:hypothetical protein
MPTIKDLVEAKKLIEMMSQAGIKEDFPPRKGRLDYEKLTGPAIRTFNRIIHYMKENNIASIADILPLNSLKKVELVRKGKDKTTKTQTINVWKLTHVFRGVGIIKPNEDLDQDFTDFVEISSEYDGIIMVPTLERAIKDASKCKYFKTFGTEPRKGFFNPSQNNLTEKDPQILQMMNEVNFSNINDKAGTEQDMKIRVS